MPQPHDTLTGLKVLVVEDSYLIAEHVSDLLTQHGAEVIGPVGRLGPGLKLVEWPDKAAGLLPTPDLTLSIDLDADGTRTVHWRAGTPLGADLLAQTD